MNALKHLLLSLLALLTISLKGQHTDANVFGDVQSNGEHVPFVNIYLEGTTFGTTTDQTGHYMLIDLPEGEVTIVAQALGYKTVKKTITPNSGKTIEVNFDMEQERMTLNEVVVTGTKTFKRQTESAVIVNVLNHKALTSVEACNISEGLRFQPGLRVETDCQTCNYTQLRMNGLGGGYSQILINGRPVFSPLTGLYGMEQIPANMVDRIEVVRGGGSALYGSSAIGGTVNIITRIPTTDSYDISGTAYSINGDAMDYQFNGNVNMLTQKRNAGVSVFVNRRQREAYDHKNSEGYRDGFSELPELRTNSFGANIFYKPTYNQKLELSLSSLTEFRYGGEIDREVAHLANQSEERNHFVLMGSADHQINFNDENSSFITYAGGQYTYRTHYTGIFPDDSADIQKFLTEPPYGTSDNSTFQLGTQLNHRVLDFLGGTNVFTVGAEYVFDDIIDSIPAYQYGTNQQTHTLGAFAQSDWQIIKSFNVLAGLRLDKHNLVDKPILSPRVSVLYRLKEFTQFRFTWGTGFRAPQAFDADLHIAFAGGGISRVLIDPDLKEERSNSISGSVNFDKPTENFIAGFTIEGFYTKLKDAFYLEPIGEDDKGELFEKRNGPGATVQGATLELRGNYRKKIQVESGFTLQTSRHDEAVLHIDGLEAKRAFLRTPNQYGYLILTLMPNNNIDASLSTLYTGPMQLAHYAGAPEQTNDEFITTNAFTEINVKLGYTFNLKNIDSGIELFGGIKNITNNYQNDFDSGKNRDSGYVYGPSLPRTVYFGLRLKSL